MREASVRLIDLEHRNVVGAGVEHEQKAAESVDGHCAARKVLGKWRAGCHGKSAGLAVLHVCDQLRRGTCDGNGIQHVLLLRTLSAGAGSNRQLEKKYRREQPCVRH